MSHEHGRGGEAFDSFDYYIFYGNITINILTTLGKHTKDISAYWLLIVTFPFNFSRVWKSRIKKELRLEELDTGPTVSRRSPTSISFLGSFLCTTRRDWYIHGPSWIKWAVPGAMSEQTEVRTPAHKMKARENNTKKTKNASNNNNNNQQQRRLCWFVDDCVGKKTPQTKVRQGIVLYWYQEQSTCATLVWDVDVAGKKAFFGHCWNCNWKKKKKNKNKNEKSEGKNSFKN